MNKDLSSFRLTSMSELEPFKEKMGQRAFFRYSIRVYEQLYQIPPDRPFIVNHYVKRQNQDLFIKIACVFMIDYPGFIQFNNDFTQIKNVRF